MSDKVEARDIYAPDEHGRKLAREASLSYSPDGGWHLLLDGVEFPWYVKDGSVRIETVSMGEMPGVTLTIMADRVTVDHSLNRVLAGEQYDAEGTQRR